MNIPEIQGFEVEGKVGQGGMATVWKARQVSLDRSVAIKVLLAQWAHDPNDVDRFQTEARSAAKLKHPAIIQVYDASFAEGQYFFVMEYIDGYTVGDWMRRKGQLSQKDALLVAECVADGLAYAWENERIIHCDIKPDNIMIDGDGTVKVADLGLARTINIMRPRSDVDDEVLGTPAYMSPEQAQGLSDLDCRTDIYALGCMLYHMVTGKMPFAGLDDEAVLQKHVSGTFPDALDLTEGLSKPFCGMLEKMLAKNPEQRQADWREVIKDIHRVQHGRMPTGIPPPGESTMERSDARSAEAGHRYADDLIRRTYAEERRGKSRWIVSAVVAFCLVAAFATVLFHRPDEVVPLHSSIEGAEAVHDSQRDVAASTQDEARRLYDEARTWFRDNPDQFDEVIKKMRLVVESFPDSRSADHARREIKRIVSMKQYEIERVMHRLRETVLESESSGDRRGALDLLEGYDGAFAEETELSRLDLIAEIKERMAAEAEQRQREDAELNRSMDAVWRRLSVTLLDDGAAEGMRMIEELVEKNTTENTLGEVHDIIAETAAMDTTVLNSFRKDCGKEIDLQTVSGVQHLAIVDIDEAKNCVIAEQRIIVGGHSAAREVRFSPHHLAAAEYMARAGGFDKPAAALAGIIKNWPQLQNDSLQKLSASIPEPLAGALLAEIDERKAIKHEAAGRKYLADGLIALGVQIDHDSTVDEWHAQFSAAREKMPMALPQAVQLADGFDTAYSGTRIAGDAGDLLAALRAAAEPVAPVEKQRPPERLVRRPRRMLQPGGAEHRIQDNAIVSELIKKNPELLVSDINILRDPGNRQVLRVEILTSRLNDIEPLQQLAGLQELLCAAVPPHHVWRNHPVAPLENLSPLRNMRLAVLCINNTSVRDITPLGGHPLEELTASHSKINDISVLRNAPLRKLLLRGTGVRDIAVLRGMPLRQLDLSETAVFDFRPLSGALLERLEVADSQLRELTVLRGMPLQQLNMARTKAFDFSPLMGMPLESLVLDGTQIKDLNVLRGMRLTHLSINETAISDIGVLSGMPLNRLSMRGTLVNDFNPLAALPLLSLDLSQTRITDVDLLARLPLKNLNLSGTKVSDLTPLAGLELASLDISNTRVDDISPLANMPLRVLSCRGTRVKNSDYAVLARLPIERITIDNPDSPHISNVLRQMRNLRVVNGAEWVR